MVQATAIPSTMATFGRGQMAFYRKHGFEVIFCSAAGDGLDVVLAEGVDFYEMDFRRALSPIADLVTVWKLYHLFRRLKPDVIQLKTLKPGILGSLAGRLAKVPLIIRYKQGYTRDCNYRGLKKKLLLAADKYAYAFSDQVVAVSHELRQIEIDAGAIRPEKIIVYGQGTSHGIDLERFALTEKRKQVAREIRSHYGIPREAVLLGTVMRVNIEKGITELIRAFQQLEKINNDLHLLIVGNYDIRNLPESEIMDTISRHPKIHLTGWVSNIEDYYPAMDIFVLPTYREGFCNSNIEAGLMGLPVVSTDVIGVNGSSVINGKTGLIVPPRQVQPLVEAIQFLIDSPQKRREYADNAAERVRREFSNRFVWHQQLKGLCQLLQEKGIVPPVEPDEISGVQCPLCNGDI